jgi:hypothetical protein
MIKSDVPALFDPTLFWGVIFVILFYFSLRGFAPSREQITLQGVRRFPSVISREDAKPRRKNRIPMVTLLLSEESAVFEAHLCDRQRRAQSPWKGVWHTLLLSEKSGIFSRDLNTPT